MPPTHVPSIVSLMCCAVLAMLLNKKELAYNFVKFLLQI